MVYLMVRFIASKTSLGLVHFCEILFIEAKNLTRFLPFTKGRFSTQLQFLLTKPDKLISISCLFYLKATEKHHNMMTTMLFTNYTHNT